MSAKKDTIIGFLEEFKNRGQESRLKVVGFDGGSGDITSLGELFKELNLTNIWMGDGILNCLDPVYPTIRLKEALEVRNTGGYIKKVYAWTVDLKFDMRRDLDLNVDGFITNRPAQLIDVINENRFKDRYRPAAFDDPIFQGCEEQLFCYV